MIYWIGVGLAMKVAQETADRTGKMAYAIPIDYSGHGPVPHDSRHIVGGEQVVNLHMMAYGNVYYWECKPQPDYPAFVHQTAAAHG